MGMITRTYTAAINGLKPIKIEVEIDSNRGTPNLVLIGLATKAVEESKERITSALINCGIKIRSKRTVVNLAPADIKKSSPTFELAIAVGMLKLYQEIKINTDDTIFFGELALDGKIKSIRGALPLVIAAKKMGFQKVVLPASNQKEVAIISGIKIYPLDHLQQYLDFTQQKITLSVLSNKKYSPNLVIKNEVRLENICDQENVKRALTIAAAGGHHLLMVGPPGAGKSLLAKSISSILPPLNQQEAIEVTNIYSVSYQKISQLITNRPFRSPHHTSSPVGLIGGGRYLRPGEISLAHRGVLFLDEFTEFESSALESLRQPLEDRQITIVRAHGSVTYPAAFSLIAAANPCPCGWQGSQEKECRCSELSLKKYQKKFSGPILDRIDLFIRVKPVNLKKLAHYQPQNNLTSAQVRSQVITAKNIQQQYLKSISCNNNAELTAPQIKKKIVLTKDVQSLLEPAAQKLKLTARSYFKVIKLAQTIANLEQKTTIEKNHLAESLQYRQNNLF